MSGLLGGIGGALQDVGGAVGDTVDGVGGLLGGNNDQATPAAEGNNAAEDSNAAEGNNAAEEDATAEEPADNPGGALIDLDLLNPDEPAEQEADEEGAETPAATPAANEDTDPLPVATLVASATEAAGGSTSLPTVPLPSSASDAETPPVAQETTTPVQNEQEEPGDEATPPSASPTVGLGDSTSPTDVPGPPEVESGNNIVPIVGASAGGLLFIIIVAIVMTTRYRRRKWPFARRERDFIMMDEEEKGPVGGDAANKWDPSSRISKFITSKNF